MEQIANKEEKGIFFNENFTYIASKLQFLFDNSYQRLLEENQILLPASIFRNELSGLEAITTFLKEELNLRFCEISKLLNRDDRTIWNAYNKAGKKSEDNFYDESKINIPLEIFADRKFSILESLAYYMKNELRLRYCEIAILLRKDQRTIWTVCNRANKKVNGKNR